MSDSILGVRTHRRQGPRAVVLRGLSCNARPGRLSRAPERGCLAKSTASPRVRTALRSGLLAGDTVKGAAAARLSKVVSQRGRRQASLLPAHTLASSSRSARALKPAQQCATVTAVSASAGCAANDARCASTPEAWHVNRVVQLRSITLIRMPEIAVLMARVNPSKSQRAASARQSDPAPITRPARLCARCSTALATPPRDLARGATLVGAFRPSVQLHTQDCRAEGVTWPRVGEYFSYRTRLPNLEVQWSHEAYGHFALLSGCLCTTLSTREGACRTCLRSQLAQVALC